MKGKNTRIVFLVVLLVILAAAFLLLEFRLMRAQMAVDSESETFAFSVSGDERPLPLEQDLDLCVQAPQELEDELVEALREALKTNPYVRDVRLQGEPMVAAEDSVLVVTMDEPSVLFWSPFYTRSVITARVAYASDGEVDWIDQEPVVFESTEAPEEPVVRVRTTHEFEGNAYGLISGPGYAAYLVGELATQINGSLADTLANAGS